MITVQSGQNPHFDGVDSRDRLGVLAGSLERQVRLTSSRA